MVYIALTIFIIGYLAIVFEHNLELNKAAPALLIGVFCWTVYILFTPEKEHVIEHLGEHLGEISSILFFLLSAMTIVEIIDKHRGFDIITSKIKTKSKPVLIWILAGITFFLSSLLDNLTTTIVMVSLSGKILKTQQDRLWVAGVIVIAANAGGAFSPLGDVTTTMLWIGNQITAESIIFKLFLPSIMVLLIPLFFVSFRFKGQTIDLSALHASKHGKESTWVLIFGIIMLMSIPAFKIITHLPPVMGALMALGTFWIILSFLHNKKPAEERKQYSVMHALEKVDTPSILFFLGILLAIGALQEIGLLKNLATFLQNTLKNEYLIGTALGIISAIVDNVPLVAAAQGMYDLTTYPTDHDFWSFLALTTGTGGSAIIIGSAAGVAAMGIEKIDFIWYLKNISWLALLGFIAGIFTYILQTSIF